MPSTSVRPLTLEQAEALLEGDDVFAARFGMPVAPGYLDFPEVLEPTRQAIAAGMPPEWWSHLIVDEEIQTVVGFGGYKGPPANGEVEIGYSIAPDHQRRGHATAAAQLFVNRARAAGCTLVSAHTLPEPNASTRVLQRCGLERTGEFEDADLGTVWRWELVLD
jgi:ribosomal-protein-alanine N-acetyltransferase